MTPPRLLMAIGLAVCALAQTRRAFDVVSIRPSPTTNELIYTRTSPGGLMQSCGNGLRRAFGKTVGELTRELFGTLWRAKRNRF